MLCGSVDRRVGFHNSHVFDVHIYPEGPAGDHCFVRGVFDDPCVYGSVFYREGGR